MSIATAAVQKGTHWTLSYGQIYNTLGSINHHQSIPCSKWATVVIPYNRTPLVIPSTSTLRN
ncbi:hypothetical protein H5410_054166 [Solanum commersonii]|uniref:Uncharacterized protein n=1 Tax=Solanum commersonii TaxID=4109 RepID=A0A9J5X5V5_SOLCO|nr:hypothetical protein H5410_054166 [Solanum commersonii]